MYACARWLMLGLWSTPILAAAQGDSLRRDQREVVRVDSMRLAAVLRADTAVLKNLLTPDWLLISGVTGERLSRAGYLTGLASGTRRIAAAEHDSLRVRVYGTTAVVTGRSTAAVRRRNVSTATTVWFTHVYVKEAGEWRMLSMHVSTDPRPVRDGIRPDQRKRTMMFDRQPPNER